MLVGGVFVFVSLDPGRPIQHLSPRVMVREREGITLILPLDQAQAHGLTYTFRSRLITLNVHSSLAAVGLLARVATALADQEIPINPVAGFYHDHLFVPQGRELEAMEVLRTLRLSASG